MSPVFAQVLAIPEFVLCDLFLFHRSQFFIELLLIEQLKQISFHSDFKFLNDNCILSKGPTN